MLHCLLKKINFVDFQNMKFSKIFHLRMMYNCSPLCHSFDLFEERACKKYCDKKF